MSGLGMCIRCRELRVELPPGTNRLKDEPEICATCEDIYGLTDPRPGETRIGQAIRGLEERIRFAKDQIKLTIPARDRVLADSHRAGKETATNLRECAKDYEQRLAYLNGVIARSQKSIAELAAKAKQQGERVTTTPGLQETREQLGMTRADLAERFKVSADYIKKIEVGKRKMPPEIEAWLGGTKKGQNRVLDRGVR